MTSGSGTFDDLFLPEGELTRSVPRRYAELELCLEWGLTSEVWDALPAWRRVEMWAFWRAKHERQRMMDQQNQMNQRVSAPPSVATPSRPPRRR